MKIISRREFLRETAALTGGLAVAPLLGGDDVDAVHLHNLGDFDRERLFTPDGALAGLKEARKRGLPGVACAVIGFANEEEARKAVEVTRAYRPLSPREKAALLAEGRKLAKARGKYFGEVEG